MQNYSMTLLGNGYGAAHQQCPDVCVGEAGRVLTSTSQIGHGKPE